jgi:hypothetical protein
MHAIRLNELFCSPDSVERLESMPNERSLDMDHEEIFFTIEEMEKKYIEYVQALEKLIHVEGEDILFKLPEGSTDNNYRVGLDRCSTPEAILAWVRHLTEKKWMTVPVIHRFVELATEHHGINIQTHGTG